MSVFRSGFADHIEDFIRYRIASGLWNSNYEDNLTFFDHYCADAFPPGSPLCQEMVNIWCAKRTTELNRACDTRIRVIRAFIRYLKDRNLTNVDLPAKLKKEPVTYVPHAFTKEELQRFFYECDNIPVNSSLHSKVHHLTCPVFFRLLYSSGIRTTEARFLGKTDFNPIDGVLNIQKSKGYDQHYVALHKSMTDLLVRYDHTISKLLPNRTFFFEKHNGGHYSRQWVTETFHTLWRKANTAADVVPYELRHNYAIENINGWTGNDGFGLSEHLLYLSKSMGHRNLSSTLYYYSIVPRLADILLEKTEMGFNEIVREVNYEKE
ncbi:MAG: tyrosine-type recombinase/integrase [Lachnospiraceae bacterium]|nr:tyrosine-type recombinase/integrase [Lachnospiraceae bacterium]